MRRDRQKMLGGFAALVVLIGIPVIALNSSNGKTGESGQNSGGKRMKLSNTRYAPFAYKVSGGSLSQQAKTALAGFTVEKKRSGGQRVVKLVANRAEYSDQTYHLAQGEQLYFIETSMGDDSNGKEYSIGDDTGVVVDSEGYVLRS